jgi:GNAT superfamily N-acetyltransferase
MTSFTWRHASQTDIRLLAALNRQLIDDEGHRDTMSIAELADRMRAFLAADYRAALFERDGRLVAYALWAERGDGLYLRQFFVVREARRGGIGRQAMAILRQEAWPQDARLYLEVLTGNTRGLAFWRALGFADYALTLELLPSSSASGARASGPLHES